MKTGWIFFGTDTFAVETLAELAHHGWSPELIITTPDNTRGRGLKRAPPPVKLWADEYGLTTLQPTKLSETKATLQKLEPKFALAVAYGRILPAEIFTLPQHGTINLHPSLLPRYRGPAPLQATIMNGDTETGVTVMVVDGQIDHGPIIAQKNYQLIADERYERLSLALARIGAELLVATIPDWLQGRIKPRPQQHRLATFTKKVTKQDGEITLIDSPEVNSRKFRSYTPNPGVYFFTDDGTRVKITAAEFTNNEFTITRVIPANKKEMPYSDFLRGYSI